MFDVLLATDAADVIALLLRVMLGVVMLPHGAQKVFGWFGGYGISGTMGYFTGTLRIPSPVAAAVILIESLGALALVVGLGTRVAAAGVIAVMVGAVLTSHLRYGFFMNWTGDGEGEGFEYHLLAIVIAVVLVITGAGALSVDAVLASR